MLLEDRGDRGVMRGPERHKRRHDDAIGQTQGPDAERLSETAHAVFLFHQIPVHSGTVTSPEGSTSCSTICPKKNWTSSRAFAMDSNR